MGCDDVFAHLALRAPSHCIVTTNVLVCLPHVATGSLHSRSLTPDDDVFQHLAHTYASRNLNMKKGDQCKNKMDFPNGITNGYSWYPLKGEFPFISIMLLTACTQGHQLVFVDPSHCHKFVRLWAVPSITRAGGMTGCGEVLRQPRLPFFLQMLAQLFPTESGTMPRKMDRAQIFTPSLMQKSDMQRENGKGSVIRPKIEI